MTTHASDPLSMQTVTSLEVICDGWKLGTICLLLLHVCSN